MSSSKLAEGREAAEGGLVAELVGWEEVGDLVAEQNWLWRLLGCYISVRPLNQLG